jgi:hypothetical protein
LKTLRLTTRTKLLQSGRICRPVSKLFCSNVLPNGSANHRQTRGERGTTRTGAPSCWNSVVLELRRAGTLSCTPDPPHRSSIAPDPKPCGAKYEPTGNISDHSEILPASRPITTIHDSELKRAQASPSISIYLSLPSTDHGGEFRFSQVRGLLVRTTAYRQPQDLSGKE